MFQRGDMGLTELAPQNPNLRGVNDPDEARDPLDGIIREFNERWFQGWRATPEEQQVKFLSLADSIRAHPDFEEKYQQNPDTHNQMLAFEKIFEDVMLKTRRTELELDKLLANDGHSRPPCSKACNAWLDYSAALKNTLKMPLQWLFNGHESSKWHFLNCCNSVAIIPLPLSPQCRDNIFIRKSFSASDPVT